MWVTRLFEIPFIKVHKFQDFAIYVPISGHLLEESFSELSVNSFFNDKIAGYYCVKKPNLSGFFFLYFR
jgi:hypothetical protein